MAKNKGKSRRRVKGWQQKYRTGRDEVDQTHSRQKINQPPVKLGDGRFADAEGLDDLPTVEGLVVGFFPGGTLVRIDGQERICGIAKTFRAPEGTSPLAVGDTVTVAMSEDDHSGQTDKDRADGMVLSRQPRETALARPQPRSGKRRDEHTFESFDKVIAANMDILLIVSAVRKPRMRSGLIERFLIIAERGELTPVLVINKIDLGDPDQATLDLFDELSLPIYLVSAATGDGVEELLNDLAGKRSVLAGLSGVGKTTLINRILPDVQARTQEVREKDNRGRHTTTAAQVYDLPGGGMLVDTPGIRELGMHLEPSELGWYFQEFEDIAPHCRFNDCTHTHEPGCAIQQAVQDGKILPRRYRSYLRILDSLDE